MVWLWLGDRSNRRLIAVRIILSGSEDEEVLMEHADIEDQVSFDVPQPFVMSSLLSFLLE